MLCTFDFDVVTAVGQLLINGYVMLYVMLCNVFVHQVYSLYTVMHVHERTIMRRVELVAVNRFIMYQQMHNKSTLRHIVSL